MWLGFVARTFSVCAWSRRFRLSKLQRRRKSAPRNPRNNVAHGLVGIDALTGDFAVYLWWRTLSLIGGLSYDDGRARSKRAHWATRSIARHGDRKVPGTASRSAGC